MRLLACTTLSLVLAACAQTCEIPGPVMLQHGSQGTMFVANKRGASLSRIDIANGEETHSADTCENPHELTVSPDDTLVAVACYSGRTLEVFATKDLRRIVEFELGENARVHSALWLDDYSIIAGAEGRGSLYRIVDMESDAPRPPIEIGGGRTGPHLLAVSLDQRTAWGTII
ncbi:MAG: YncE family protein, partial [Alteraurantiacibacter sp.]